MLRINDTAPDFTAETTQGPIKFHEWIGDGWAVLFSHPKDFTPVCTTELGYMAGLEPEFSKRHTKIIGLSVDPVASHGKWAADIEETQGYRVNYPMIGDPELKIAKLYDMLPADSGEVRFAQVPRAFPRVLVDLMETLADRLCRQLQRKQRFRQRHFRYPLGCAPSRR
jgi:alkyl hydroperoxide reductase subunit AhpC